VSRLTVRVFLLLVVVGLAMVPLLVRVGPTDDATVQQAEQVCTAVVESRHADAIAASEMLPPLDSEAARQVAECRCWALQRVGDEGRCAALLDRRLAGADERGSDWVPPAPLVRPVIRLRLDRGDVADALALGARSLAAHPASLHLNELLLEAQVAMLGETEAFAAFALRIERQERSGTAFEPRIVLAMQQLQRGHPEAALGALGSEPPRPGHPQLSAWFHNRVNAEAAVGDLVALQISMRRWLELGGPAAELAARYAVALSMAGLEDPRTDIVSLLRGAIEGRAAIDDPLIVAWLYQRLVAHLMAGGARDEALAAYDEGSLEVALDCITRGEIQRAIAFARVQHTSDPRALWGTLLFRLASAGSSVLVSPAAGAPPDTDFERFVPTTGEGIVSVERPLAAWPVRWVVLGEGDAVLVSGSVWPVPGEVTEIVIRSHPNPDPPPRAQAGLQPVLAPRQPGDGVRRVFTVVLDCGDWRLVQYLRARGELPTIGVMIQHGRRAVLRSSPALTAAAMQALVHPGHDRSPGVVRWLHQLGLELSGLEAVGDNPLRFLEAVMPRSESLFETVGAGPHTAANMLFSHGSIDAGQHAQLIGPNSARSGLRLSRVVRPLSADEKGVLGATVETERYRRQLERIAGEFDAALELVRGDTPDLVMLRIEALDLLTHALYSELAEASQDDGRSALLDVYRYLDLRLAALQGEMDADDVLLVMSDHGIRNAMEHAEDAIFIAVGGGVTPGRVPGEPEIGGVPRVIADWLGVETDWPLAGFESDAPKLAKGSTQP